MQRRVQNSVGRQPRVQAQREPEKPGKRLKRIKEGRVGHELQSGYTDFDQEDGIRFKLELEADEVEEQQAFKGAFNSALEHESGPRGRRA